MPSPGTVYLIPTLLDEAGLAALPAYVLEAVKSCQVFFVENERTTRRFLKQLSRDVVIDDYEWYVMARDRDGDRHEPDPVASFRVKLKSGATIGILSEAGCPGIADPGQALVAVAQEAGALVRPLVGPSSILLALMASGMNGQQFCFHGYLPIQSGDRIRAIRELEAESDRKGSTQIFIETPYRNQALMESLLKTCRPDSRLCVACHLTGPEEYVKTRTIAAWQQEPFNFHKQPAIFLLSAK